MSSRWTIAIWAAGLLTLGALTLASGGLRTPEQAGYSLYSKSEYKKAAETFTDSYWKAIALYRDGQFKAAANIFAGFDSAEGAFNHGNALLFQGNYEQATKRYERALELRPEWEDAKINRAIAVARAEALDFEGANMTDGKIGADDYVINNEPSSNQNDNDQTEVVESTELSDAELRAVWLRQVQTDPADFLKSKFNYQLQKGGSQ
ncbi:MAG: hypothetical protein ACPGES_02415 [Coraliomargarita sp.]